MMRRDCRPRVVMTALVWLRMARYSREEVWLKEEQVWHLSRMEL
jgi:hypothetical protein